MSENVTRSFSCARRHIAMYQMPDKRNMKPHRRQCGGWLVKDVNMGWD